MIFYNISLLPSHLSSLFSDGAMRLLLAVISIDYNDSLNGKKIIKNKSIEFTLKVFLNICSSNSSNRLKIMNDDILQSILQFLMYYIEENIATFDENEEKIDPEKKKLREKKRKSGG